VRFVFRSRPSYPAALQLRSDVSAKSRGIA
jgi:hypothetical protein